MKLLALPACSNFGLLGFQCSLPRWQCLLWSSHIAHRQDRQLQAACRVVGQIAQPIGSRSQIERQNVAILVGNLVVDYRRIWYPSNTRSDAIVGAFTNQ